MNIIELAGTVYNLLTMPSYDTLKQRCNKYNLEFKVVSQALKIEGLRHSSLNILRNAVHSFNQYVEYVKIYKYDAFKKKIIVQRLNECEQTIKDTLQVCRLYHFNFQMTKHKLKRRRTI